MVWVCLMTGLVSVCFSVSVPCEAKVFWKQDKKEGMRYLDGVSAYREGDYTKALAIFRNLRHKLVKTDAEPFGKITYYLAITHARTGQLDKARTYYEELIAKRPNTREAQLATQGLAYLPQIEKEHNALDIPPRFVPPESRLEGLTNLNTLPFIKPNLNRENIDKAVDTRAVHENDTQDDLRMLELRPPVDLSAVDPPAYQATSDSDDTVNAAPVASSPERETSSKESSVRTQAPQQQALSPQDIMAFQMMMNMMSQGNNNNTNGMMNMNGVSGMGNTMSNPQWLNQMMAAQKNAGQAGGSSQNPSGANPIDPQMFSTMMMNQMMNNMNFTSGNGNN